MLNHTFFNYLEYRICKILENLDNDSVKGFWCDGVLLNETGNNYSKKYINDNRIITLKAFVGKNGQEEYELILKFGRKALSRYARNMEIQECIPDDDHNNWFHIDTIHRKIELQLT